MLVSGTGMNGLPDFDSCVSEHSSTASRAHDCGLMSGAHDKAIRPLLQSHGQALVSNVEQTNKQTAATHR